jgi:uncharacterized protein
MSVPRRDEVLDILRQHKAELAAHYGVTTLGIFGSVARDDAVEDSDVDIVFESVNPNLFRTASMKQWLEAILRRQVDVIRWRDSINPRLKARIIREACYV